MTSKTMPETFAGPLTEPCVITDTFCSELALVESIGPCLRLTFAVAQTIHGCDGASERTVVAKVVIPAEAVASLLRQISGPAKSVGLARGSNEPRTLVN
ncbi:hypothetical protein [Ancylobacter sp.]|uniref:hypothetical protein n=1 Tax=Ancylobacter sp. TaxID=1872567 RepID=UPI003D09C616